MHLRLPLRVLRDARVRCDVVVKRGGFYTSLEVYTRLISITLLLSFLSKWSHPSRRREGRGGKGKEREGGRKADQQGGTRSSRHVSMFVPVTRRPALSWLVS